MAYVSLKPFDPEARFSAARDFALAGHQLKRGAEVPRDVVSLRRLRLLYESRWIVPVVPEAAKVKGAKK